MRRGRRRLHILTYDSAGACLAEYALLDFPLPEEAVVELSVHYFCDPQPCAIHRAAVVTRAMEELLQGREMDVRYPLSALSVEERRYFDTNRVSAFAFKEEMGP